MMKQMILAGAAALALTACADMDPGMSHDAQSQSAPMAGSASAMPAPAPADYMLMAGQSDAYEMQSSQLALAQARSGRVKDFANMMIRDHGKTTATLMAAARRSGMSPPPPPPPLRPDQQQMIADLQRAGPDFDRVYVQQQVMAHQQALDLHSSFAAGGADPNLRTAAQAAVPIVRAHLGMVQAMAGGMR